jgi:predicted small lipoprotein YifL
MALNKYCNRMKLTLVYLICVMILTGCGQPGPLYLPTDKPPVYVEPEAENKAKDEAKESNELKQDQDKVKPALNSETAPESEQQSTQEQP